MVCTYCGARATDRDHVVPHSFLRVGKKRRGFDTGEIVPACRECNVLLGNKLFTTVESRADYLIGAYRRRYGKLLTSPKWTPKELAELGPTLRSNLLKSNQQRVELEVRLEALEKRPVERPRDFRSSASSNFLIPLQPSLWAA